MTLYTPVFLKFSPETLALTILVYTIKTIFIEYATELKAANSNSDLKY